MTNQNPNSVNIGSAERPVWVPAKALAPDSPEGRAWWGKLAGGSVILEPEDLDALIARVDEQPKEKP